MTETVILRGPSGRLLILHAFGDRQRWMITSLLAIDSPARHARESDGADRTTAYVSPKRGWPWGLLLTGWKEPRLDELRL